MTFERRDQLIVEYATQSCVLTDRDKDCYEEHLRLLARIIEPFPAASLHIEVAHHARSGTWEVKTTLVLAASLRLFASSTGDAHIAAFRTCVRRLIDGVRSYKERRDPRSARQGPPNERPSSAPAHSVQALVQPDFASMQQAADGGGDYMTYRNAIAVYRDSLRNRVGRRIERFPSASARRARGSGATSASRRSSRRPSCSRLRASTSARRRRSPSASGSSR